VYPHKFEIRSTKSETNSKIKFSNDQNKALVLTPKAGIRIIQYSAGAERSGGNEIIANRRQQQQKGSGQVHGLYGGIIDNQLN